MIKSDKIVFTEPVTRPNRNPDLWESDSIWLYRERPVLLYPTDDDGKIDGNVASPRLSRQRLSTIVEKCKDLVTEVGAEMLLRSEKDGFLILRRHRIGWLIACARPDAGQYKVAAELSRFGESVALKFESENQEEESEVFPTRGNTSLIAGGVGFEDKLPDDLGEETVILSDVKDSVEEPQDRAPSDADAKEPDAEPGERVDVSWPDVAEDLDAIVKNTSGRFRMFAVKAWRQCSGLVPINFDLMDGFTAHIAERLTVRELNEMSRVFVEWRSTVETTSGEIPERMSADPEWVVIETADERAQ